MDRHKYVEKAEWWKELIAKMDNESIVMQTLIVLLWNLPKDNDKPEIAALIASLQARVWGQIDGP